MTQSPRMALSQTLTYQTAVTLPVFLMVRVKEKKRERKKLRFPHMNYGLDDENENRFNMIVL